MVVLIKLFYAAAIACLVVLLVAFGIRTVYLPPDEPAYPPFPARPPIKEDGQPDYSEYEEAQQQYLIEFEAYLDERAEYRRNVLVVAAALGIASLAAGVALPNRLDAIRLGLVLGGFATLLYGVIQAGDDLDRGAGGALRRRGHRPRPHPLHGLPLAQQPGRVAEAQLRLTVEDLAPPQPRSHPPASRAANLLSPAAA